MEKRQVWGFTLLGCIAFGALVVGVLEKLSAEQAALSEKRRLEAESRPEPILEAQPIPDSSEAMAAEILEEASWEETLMTGEELDEEAEIQSDIQTLNELTTSTPEEAF